MDTDALKLELDKMNHLKDWLQLENITEAIEL